MPTAQALEDVGVPHPHEFVGTVTDASPAYFVKCTCGYSGLSRNKSECPDCVARAEHHSQQLVREIVAPSKGEVDLKGMVDSAVKAATSGLNELVAKLTQQLAEAKSEGGNK